MKLKKNPIFNITLAFVVSSVIILSSGYGILTRLQLGGLDFLFRMRGPIPYNSSIVIIEINDDNISKVGRWPWPREWHATVTKALKDMGASYIYFDILFSEEAEAGHDDAFAEAIEYAGNVYLPFAFQEKEVTKEAALYPIEKFKSKVKGLGSINIYPDMDGAIRKLPIYFKDKEGDVYPHIALEISKDYLGASKYEVKGDKLEIEINKDKKIKIPLMDENRVLVNWLGKWSETFTHYSYLDILLAYNAILSGEEPKIDISSIKNSICLVAVTAIGLYDIDPISLEPEYPGIGVMATTINNIINDNFIDKTSHLVNLLLIYLLSLIPLVFITGDKPLKEIAIVFSGGVLFFFVVLLFFKNNYWIEFTLPLLSLTLSHFSIATFHFVMVSIEKQQLFKLAITDELTGLANIRHFTQLLKIECLKARNNPETQFCVIMSDIDHFKSFNDTYGHAVGDLVLKEVAKVLQKSVRASDVVGRYGGEEWVILLRNTSFNNGLIVAEKIRRNVEEHVFRDKDRTYKAAISLGVSYFKPEDDQDTIVKRADDGLYKAKDSGRNRVETIETVQPTEINTNEPT